MTNSTKMINLNQFLAEKLSTKRNSCQQSSMIKWTMKKTNKLTSDLNESQILKLPDMNEWNIDYSSTFIIIIYII